MTKIAVEAEALTVIYDAERGWKTDSCKANLERKLTCRLRKGWCRYAERRRGRERDRQIKQTEKRKGNTQSLLGTPSFLVHKQGNEKLLFSWTNWNELLLHANKRTYWKQWTLASNLKSKYVSHFLYSYNRPNTCPISSHKPLGEHSQITVNV